MMVNRFNIQIGSEFGKSKSRSGAGKMKHRNTLKYTDNLKFDMELHSLHISRICAYFWCCGGAEMRESLVIRCFCVYLSHRSGGFLRRIPWDVLFLNHFGNQKIQFRLPERLKIHRLSGSERLRKGSNRWFCPGKTNRMSCCSSRI